MRHFALLLCSAALTSTLCSQMITPPPAHPPAPLNLDDAAVGALYRPIAEACHQAILANADPDQTLQTCRKAANVASRFSPSGHFIERRAAYTFASTAHSRNHLWESGLAYANRAVAIAELGHDDPSGTSGAYGVRAEAEVGLGKLKEADRDLDKAEQIIRLALLQPAVPPTDGAAAPLTNAEYSQNLKAFLTFHAQVLSALNRTAQSHQKTEEASRL